MGYGDIYPVQPVIRVFLTLLLIFYIGLISQDLSLLSDALKNVSSFDADYYFKDHIIIFGEFDPENLKKMLLNFYTEFNSFDDSSIFKVLLVKNEEPNAEISSILDDINLMNNVKFLKANLNKLEWTKKANLIHAAAVFGNNFLQNNKEFILLI